MYTVNETTIIRTASAINHAISGINRTISEQVQMRYCRQLAESCIEAKAGLIDMLSKHPNWNPDDLRVEFDADYERPKDSSLAQNSLMDLTWALMYSTGTDELSVEYPQLYRAAETIRYNAGMLSANSTITTSTADRIKLRLPDAHIHEGAKSTRAVMKLLRQYGIEMLDKDKYSSIISLVNRYYTVYADAMNPLKLTKHTVLSVNPADFLMMSYGESWHSCHNIGFNGTDVGCYSGGTLSYAYDDCSMIMYTINPDVSRDFENNSYNSNLYSDEGFGITFAPKATRQVMFWNGSVLFPSRCYPANDDTSAPIYSDHRTIAEDVISKCLGIGNLWKKVGYSCKDSDGAMQKIHFVSYGYHYPDYAYHTYPAFAPSALCPTNDELNVYFTVGSTRPICVCTGDELADDNCIVNTGHGFFCAECGEWIEGDESDYTYIEGVGTICDNCRDDNYSYCEWCNNYEPHGDVYYVNGYGHVCIHCMEINDDEFYYCSDCQEYYYERIYPRITTADCEDICPHCAVDYRACENCGEFYLEDNLNPVCNKHTGEITSWVCESCWEEDDNEDEEELDEYNDAESAVRDAILGA